MTRADGWDDAELERAGALAALVRARVGVDAQLWAVRAPGRVNLIGEHTDYSGLPVLPIAIDRSTIVVAAPRPRIGIGEIELSNADPAWPARRFAIARSIAPSPAGDWGNYVKAAIQGVIDHFATRDTNLARLRGGMMYVESRVPPAAGLSSSSALTVSAALAFMALNGLESPSIEAAQMIARSERYVGTMGGAMDQAVSILGQRDHALFIEFDPIRVRPLKMPSHAAVIFADSREVADKSGQVRAEYNRRVIECALAARILAGALELDGVKIIGDVVRRLKAWEEPVQLIATLAASAPASLTGLDSAARILGIEEQALRAELLGGGPNQIVLDSTRPLEILRRARHVLGETKRVERAAAALEAGKLDEVGALMNDSHRSLAEDFEVSTPRLDAMVECARRAGALGARLTGAGFGGSIIALCAASEAPGVIAALDREYYAPLNLSARDREASRAVLHAGPGASTIELAAA